MSEILMMPRQTDAEILSVYDAQAQKIRDDFPILCREVHHKPLVYLDNAATSQKPQVVLDALNDYYVRYNANVHRGIHTLSEEATNAYEASRVKVARFINAPDPHTLIFVRSTTEAVNLVAQAWGRAHLHKGHEILLSVMEHHSNLVPWQILANQVGAKLRFLDVREDGSLKLEDLSVKLTERTKMVALTHMSNMLGTVNPIKEIAMAAHNVGAMMFVDAAQSVPHMAVDVQALECDFLAFSGHKMCGPTGIGGLWGRRSILESMEPFMGGGSMIGEVHLEYSTWADIPEKFEAGTPNIAHAIVFGVAAEYLSNIGMDHIRAHEEALTLYLTERLQEIDGLTIYGSAPGRGAAVSFNLEDVHPSDLAIILDREGIAIRSGHHCTQPLHRAMNIKYGSSARASLYIYNTIEEVDKLAVGIQKARRFFGT